jgi:peptide/nickel transport system permease protein
VSEKNNKPIASIQSLTAKSEFWRFWNVFIRRKFVLFGLIVITVLILSAIFAPFISPYNPYSQNLDITLLQPSLKHLLGTDYLGRDTLSRLIYGTRTTLMIGILAVGSGATVGMILGLLAGYLGGATNAIIMRIIDALMSFPMLMLALVLASMFGGGGLRNVILALGIGMVSSNARVMCGQVLTIKENEYITAARSMGSGDVRIMFFHVLNNAFPPLIVLMTLMMGTCILAEAGLSYLGLGIAPPGAAWGSMVNDGYRYLLSNPILSLAPGLAIMVVVFAFNMVGDGLRDALDPKLRGKL